MEAMRVVLKRKDIERVMGCSKITALKYMKALKDSLGKSESQSVSIQEFCEYEGLRYNEVVRLIWPK